MIEVVESEEEEAKQVKSTTKIKFPEVLVLVLYIKIFRDFSTTLPTVHNSVHTRNMAQIVLFNCIRISMCTRARQWNNNKVRALHILC